jgi:low affinity Fe/Cu permease
MCKRSKVALEHLRPDRKADRSPDGPSGDLRGGLPGDRDLGCVGSDARLLDTWQLVINTSTTIVTFLMVFLIQNTQNRDSEALHLKIDELLRAMDAADTGLVDLEERSERDLALLRERYKDLAAHPALKGQVEADLPPKTASESRAASGSRNQTLRRRIQNPQR